MTTTSLSEHGSDLITDNIAIWNISNNRREPKEIARCYFAGHWGP